MAECTTIFVLLLVCHRLTISGSFLWKGRDIDRGRLALRTLLCDWWRNSDCFFDLCMTIFVLDSRLALLFYLDSVFDHCLIFFRLRLLLSPFWACFGPVPHSCLTIFVHPDWFCFALCSPYSDSGKVIVSPAGLHPSNGTLFVILLCYFSFIVFEGYPGRRSHLCWELARCLLLAWQAFED